MGQKDLTGKNFMLYPDIYADTLNALAYAGKDLTCYIKNLELCDKLFPTHADKPAPTCFLPYNRLTTR